MEEYKIYYEKIKELLKENMSENGYSAWEEVDKIIPNIWGRYSSSSNKYHKKENGRNPCLAEHVYEMLNAGIKIISIFNYKPKTHEFDCILLSIVLHDGFKYGLNPEKSSYTDKTHGVIISEILKHNKDFFIKRFDEKSFSLLEEATRYHDGKFSSEVEDVNKFSFKSKNPETFFVHILDMLSSRNLLKYPSIKEEEEIPLNLKIAK